MNTRIIQAPMAGGLSTPELAAAVCNAGGMGSLGAGYMKPEEIRAAISKIRSLTSQPFNVNLFVSDNAPKDLSTIPLMRKALKPYWEQLLPDEDFEAFQPTPVPDFHAQLKAVLEEKVPIFSFAFGIPPSDFLEAFRRQGTILIGTATNVQEAVELEKARVDYIVCQGSEAGGHRGTFIGPAKDSFIGLFALLPQVAKRVKIPLIAAGGIMDKNGVAAALHLGAKAAQMGTLFLTCSESGAAPAYKEALLKSKDTDTVVTNVFSGKEARVLRNQFSQEMSRLQDKIPPYPIQHTLTVPLRRAAARDHRADFMALYAGQASSLCKRGSAAEIISQLL